MTATRLSKKEIWETVEGFGNDELPENFFDNEASERLVTVLDILFALKSSIGFSRYQFTVDNILPHLNRLLVDRNLKEIKTAKLYEILKKAKEAGLIKITSKTVSSYEEINVPVTRMGELPSIHVTRTDGSVLPPNQLGNDGHHFFAENGEITLKLYELTEKGSAFRRIYIRLRGFET